MKAQDKHALNRILTIIFALAAAASSTAGEVAAAASPWVEAPKAKARLLAGGDRAQGQGAVAFVEIALEPGWKTYWRSPGDAGGLPPSFDWSKSANLAEAKVAFPAPRRFTDRSGNTIGYKDGVVLPVFLTPQDPDAPISLVAAIHYGICKDVCIPVEAELTLDVPAAGHAAPAAEAEAARALDRVPRAQDALKPGDPILVRAEAHLDGTAPKITIEARFADGGAGADAFLEAPDGVFVPLPERVADLDGAGTAVFEAPLGADVDIAGLRGKPLTVTLVSETGASFATFIAE